MDGVPDNCLFIASLLGSQHILVFPAKVRRAEVLALIYGVAAVLPHRLKLCHALDTLHPVEVGIRTMGDVQQDISLVVEVQVGTRLRRLAVWVDGRRLKHLSPPHFH